MTNRNKQDLARTLVDTNGQRVFTTSLVVAEHFGKLHHNVIKAIRRLPQDDFSRVNFNARNYTDERGKVYPMYEITRDGFSLLGMGFTGPEAYKFKTDFITAFALMEKELQRLRDMRNTVDWQEARANGKCIRTVLTSAIQTLERIADRQGGMKTDRNGEAKPESRHYYETVTKMIYKQLFGDGTLKDVRDKLDLIQVTFLSICESACADEIERLAALEVDYHAIYAEAKKRVIAAVEGLSASKLTTESKVRLAWDRNVQSVTQAQI